MVEANHILGYKHFSHHREKVVTQKILFVVLLAIFCAATTTAQISIGMKPIAPIFARKFKRRLKIKNKTLVLHSCLNPTAIIASSRSFQPLKR